MARFLLLVLCVACSSPATSSNSPTAAPNKSAEDSELAAVGSSETASRETPYPEFMSEQMLSSMKQCGIMVVAIRCESIVIENPGTRSQRMKLQASVEARSPEANAIKRIESRHYVGGSVFMREGKRYIAALCDGTDGVAVVSWKPLQGDADAAVTATVAEIRERLAP